MPQTPPILRKTLALAVAAALIGCGQRGPLYLPKTSGNPAAAAPSVPASSPAR